MKNEQEQKNYIDPSVKIKVIHLDTIYFNISQQYIFICDLFRSNDS